MQHMKRIQHLNTPKFNPTAFRAEIALHVLPSVITHMDPRDADEWAVRDAFEIADDYIEHFQYTIHRDAKYAAEKRAERRKAKLKTKQAVEPVPSIIAFPRGGTS